MNSYLGWFVEQMKTKFSIKVDSEEVSMESNELYHDEIDESIIPSQHLQALSNPVLFQLVTYQDSYLNEWIACIAVEEKTLNWLYVVWLKNGKSIYNSFYV